jgi:hypothetical protein
MRQKMKEINPLTDVDFARYANQSHSHLAVEFETGNRKIYERQIELLVTVRQVAASRCLSFEELLEASRVRFEETAE